MIELGYRNSSRLRPHWLRMSERVPRANSACIGTTVLNVRSDVHFSKDTWLPFWRNSMKPARFSARTTRSPETPGSFGILMRDFYCRPESLSLADGPVRNSPRFEIQLDSFAQIGPSALHISPLRSDVQFRTTCHVPAVVLGDQGGESVGHKPMLRDVHSAGKTPSRLKNKRNNGRRNK